MNCYFIVNFDLGCYYVKLERGSKKPNGEKEEKKLVVGALIAPVGWVPLALAKKNSEFCYVNLQNAFWVNQNSNQTS